MAFNKILGIESSCDDSSVAIVNADHYVSSMFSATQIKEHSIFKGVVPEIASRAHTQNLLQLVDLCLKNEKCTLANIDGIAVTSSPGLLGSLIVGTSIAKTLALANDIPFLGINHLEGHMLSPFLNDKINKTKYLLNFPFLSLVVSGGHSHIYFVQSINDYQLIGRTLDDAAGEALDKFAQLLGLKFPGGAKLDQLAKGVDTDKFLFPRPLSKKNNADFSFSGLKAAGSRLVLQLTKKELIENKKYLAASYQKAVVDSLVKKLQWAQKKTQLQHIVLSGGVSANSLLRCTLGQWCKKNKLKLSMPALKYCTDNAAMIALAGQIKMSQGHFSDQSLSPSV